MRYKLTKILLLVFHYFCIKLSRHRRDILYSSIVLNTIMKSVRCVEKKNNNTVLGRSTIISRVYQNLEEIYRRRLVTTNATTFSSCISNYILTRSLFGFLDSVIQNKPCHNEVTDYSPVMGCYI